MARVDSQRKNPRFTWWFWVVVALLVATILLTIFMMYRMSQKSKSLAPTPSSIHRGPAHPPNSKPTIQRFVSTSVDMVYVYSKSCGWCDRFNPIWDDFSRQYQGPLNLLKIEAGHPDASKYNVTGFPTVLIMKNGVQGSVFNDERTVENLVKFAAANRD